MGASTLNRLPDAVRETASFKARSVVAPEPNLAQDHARAAAAQLCDLEQELAKRYARSSTHTLPAEDVWLRRSCTVKSAAADGASCRVGSLDPLRGMPVSHRTFAEETAELAPAALPLEQVREIDRYRTRFAHHCLGTREAGIDRSDPGDAAFIATWTIWPHLADAIALAAVESAIEEVHEAMESHVEELVLGEVAGHH